MVVSFPFNSMFSYRTGNQEIYVVDLPPEQTPAPAPVASTPVRIVAATSALDLLA